ncbi:unnamed protein product [Mytilus coruscus]|uniref:Uncharacterized protein n=1 Tax=Mytilus coruscus TaxID=42192 RepID=A0A6J8E2Y4_MYTCO|nr:unnamed protein product [Mytilus coruscus]
MQAPNDRFTTVVTDEEISNLVNEKMNAKQKKNTKWAVGVFNQWRSFRTQNGDAIIELHMMNAECMNYWLERGRDEHRNLDHSQFETGQDATGRFVRFIGRNNKTFKGGLGDLRLDNKDIKHYASWIILLDRIIMEKSCTLFLVVLFGGHDEIATSGGQNIRQDSRDIATSDGQNSLRHISVTNRDNYIDDAISLQPDRDETRSLDLDIDSDNHSQHSFVKKNITNNRFQRYSVVHRDSLNTENDSRDILCDMFGEDAKTKSDKSECGIILHQSQINILNQSWHCNNLRLLSTYKEEYGASFLVSDKSANMLNLTKLDDITQDFTLQNAWA